MSLLTENQIYSDIRRTDFAASFKMIVTFIQESRAVARNPRHARDISALFDHFTRLENNHPPGDGAQL